MDVNFLRQLLDITRQMAENRALDPLLQYTMQKALTLLNAEKGYLVLADADQKINFKVKIDRDGNELEDPEGQISYSILNKVVSKGKPLVINDALIDPSFKNSDSVRDLQLRAVMCAPLIARGGTIGALYIENRQSANVFEDEDIEPLLAFANQAAIAIENAILNDELEARVAARTAELEQAMHQVERSWMEAVEANRVRTMVLGNVAHDMRSPIALGVSALSAMRDGAFGELTPKQMQWVDRTLDSMQHAIALTGDIFDLMKAEMGELVIHEDATNMRDFLDNIYNVAELMPWAKGVRFTRVIPDEMPILSIDSTRIKQVIFNLLSNAQKFTEQGEVTLYAQVEDANLIIGVRDTGPGISSELVEKIFDRFQQGTQSRETRKQGTGLGLAICRELVNRHGGQIHVKSELGQGSDFQFSLPLVIQPALSAD